MTSKEILFKADKSKERNSEQKNIENLEIAKNEIEEMLKAQLEEIKSNNIKK